MRIALVLIASLLISCKKEMKFQKKIEIPTTKTIISDSVAKKESSLPLEQKWDDSIAKLPYELLENEISVVIGVGHGWLAYDELHHFVYSNDSLLKHFIEKIPKKYIKSNKEKYHLEQIEEKAELKRNSKYYTLNVSEINTFLKYEQDDFRLKSNKLVPPPCVTDSNTYSIYFIQNHKFKSYWYYAPKITLEKCANATVNKKMLEEFIVLLEKWNVDL
ncbi:MAG: hypothetical protein ACK4M1_08705 [Flavobacterium sp.]